MMAASRIGGRMIVGEDEERGAVGPQAAEAPCRCGSRPWRARGCRSGSCGRRSWPASKSPTSANSSSVLVEGARSAEPPSSQGTCLATWLSTLPDEARLAMPLASAGKGLMSASQPSGNSRRCDQVEFGGQLGILLPVLGELRAPTRGEARCPRAPMPSRNSCRHLRRARGTSAFSGQP